MSILLFQLFLPRSHFTTTQTFASLIFAMAPAGVQLSTSTGTVTTQSANFIHVTDIPTIPTQHNAALTSSEDAHPQNSPSHLIIPHTLSSDMPNMETPRTFVYKIKDSGPELSSEFEISQAPRQKSGPAHQSNPSKQTHGDSPQREADQSFNITAAIEFQVQYDKVPSDHVKVLNITFQNHPKLKLESKDLAELKRHITQKFHQEVQQQHSAYQVRAPPDHCSDIFCALRRAMVHNELVIFFCPLALHRKHLLTR